MISPGESRSSCEQFKRNSETTNKIINIVEFFRSFGHILSCIPDHFEALMCQCSLSSYVCNLYWLFQSHKHFLLYFDEWWNYYGFDPQNNVEIDEGCSTEFSENLVSTAPLWMTY